MHEVAGSLIFLSQMSFFAKVSDPAIGGTYMTLLNTMANLGSKWPNSLVLWVLPRSLSISAMALAQTTSIAAGYLKRRRYVVTTVGLA